MRARALVCESGYLGATSSVCMRVYVIVIVVVVVVVSFEHDKRECPRRWNVRHIAHVEFPPSQPFAVCVNA